MSGGGGRAPRLTMFRMNFFLFFNVYGGGGVEI